MFLVLYENVTRLIYSDRSDNNRFRLFIALQHNTEMDRTEPMQH